MTATRRTRLRSVLVIGTGLIGTSVALALRDRGVSVFLQDRDYGATLTAAALGAGSPEEPDGMVDLAVLAVPPGRVAEVLAAAQDRSCARVYTDVASVKVRTYEEIERAGCALVPYVGGHPMAGRERSGPCAARSDLFVDRPWIVTPGARSAPWARDAVHELIVLCGGMPVTMDPRAHDQAVALLSHTPHVLSSLMAARLAQAQDGVLSLAGQGVRDVTRIAAGDSSLWADILSSNGGPIADVLRDTAMDLIQVGDLLAELGSRVPQGVDNTEVYDKAMGKLVDFLDRGRVGHDRCRQNLAHLRTV